MNISEILVFKFPVFGGIFILLVLLFFMSVRKKKDIEKIMSEEKRERYKELIKLFKKGENVNYVAWELINDFEYCEEAMFLIIHSKSLTDENAREKAGDKLLKTKLPNLRDD